MNKLKNELKCENCAYYWKEEDYDLRPFCHWQAMCADDIPPCEEEPYWEEDDDEKDYWEELDRQFKEEE